MGSVAWPVLWLVFWLAFGLGDIACYVRANAPRKVYASVWARLVPGSGYWLLFKYGRAPHG